MRLAPAGGIPQTVEFTRVEERWIPVAMASDWDGRMARARHDMQRMPLGRHNQGRMQARRFLGGLGSLLDQLAVAESQKKFDEVIGGIFAGFNGAPADPGR